MFERMLVFMSASAHRREGRVGAQRLDLKKAVRCGCWGLTMVLSKSSACLKQLSLLSLQPQNIFQQ